MFILSTILFYAKEKEEKNRKQKDSKGRERRFQILALCFGKSCILHTQRHLSMHTRALCGTIAPHIAALEKLRTCRFLLLGNSLAEGRSLSLLSETRFDSTRRDFLCPLGVLLLLLLKLKPVLFFPGSLPFNHRCSVLFLSSSSSSSPSCYCKKDNEARWVFYVLWRSCLLALLLVARGCSVAFFSASSHFLLSCLLKLRKNRPDVEMWHNLLSTNQSINRSIWSINQSINLIYQSINRSYKQANKRTKRKEGKARRRRILNDADSAVSLRSS